MFCFCNLQFCPFLGWQYFLVLVYCQVLSLVSSDCECHCFGVMGLLEIKNWVILDVPEWMTTAESLRTAPCYVLYHVETWLFWLPSSPSGSLGLGSNVFWGILLHAALVISPATMPSQRLSVRPDWPLLPLLSKWGSMYCFISMTLPDSFGAGNRIAFHLSLE